uniref:Uncharacterized protein n=1 Tax=Anopheles coluzzii TaxID=1518534 RepID=A0A8W7PB72_ANOCL
MRFSWAFWCSSSNVSGIGSYTNAFSSIMPIRLMEAAIRAAPRHAFHSPVGCFISANVWQNEARYRAFFSCTDIFFQSPFSFSRRAYKKKKNKAAGEKSHPEEIN